MAKTIKVKVDVDSEQVTILNQDTLTLTQQVRELKRALQTVPEGTKEWTLIQQKYNETKDSLDRVNVKSKELFGTMSALPGPIGNVAGQLDNTVGVLKTFSAIKFSDLKGQFIALGADLKEIGANLIKLTGIQKLYAITTVAVSKALQFVGIEATVASVGVRAFSAALIGTGIGAIVVGLGFLINAFMNTGDEADTAAIKVGRLNAEIANTDRVSKLRNEEEIARAKAKGATDTELFNIKQKQTQKELADARQKYKEAEVQMIAAEVLNGKDSKGYIDAQKLKSESAIKIDQLKSKLLVQSLDQETKVNKELSEANQKDTDKKIANSQKEADIKKAALETITKNEKEAILSLLPEREQELRKIANDYRVKIQLAEKYKEDTTLLEIAMQEALRLKRAEFAAKDTEDFENNLKKRLDELDKENADKLEKESIALELRKAQGLIGEEQFQGELFQIKLKYSTSDIERQQAQIDFLEYGKGKQKEYADFVIKSNQAIADSWYALGDSTASIFRELANLFEQGSDAAKTFAIISVVINAATGISKIAANLGTQLSQYGVASAAATAAISEGTALLATPFTAPFGAALIAAGTANKALATKGALSAKLNAGLQIGAIAASSAVQIATITGAGKSSRPAGSASSGGGSTDTATPAFSAPTQAAAPNIEKSNVSSEGKIGQIVTGAATQQGSRPLQTYVIGSQVSSQQELDRRISLSARMGG